MKNFFKKYVGFTGRISAKEYRRIALSIILMLLLIPLVLLVIFWPRKLPYVITLYGGILFFLIPYLSATSRRLHDLGMKYKFGFTPKEMLDLFIKESDGRPNQYGPAPYDIKSHNNETKE